MRLSSRLILGSVGLVCFTAAGVGVISQWNLEKELVPAATNRIQSKAVNLVGQVGAYVESAGTDVRVLRGAAETDGIVRASHASGVDPTSGRSAKSLRATLAQLFISLLDANRQYLQVRLIEAADGGREIIRADRAAAGKKPHIVPEGKLQRKGDRAYVRAALATAQGGIYVSPVELNKEFGVIQVPHVPVTRVATPVYDSAGGVFGIVIINVDMRPLFAQLHDAVASPETLYVVNGAGEFLVHPDPAKTFGFDLGRRFRIQDRFPALTGLAQFSVPTVRELRDASGMLHWVAIAPAPTQFGRTAYMIVATPAWVIEDTIVSMRWYSLGMAVAVSLMAIFVAVWMARTLTRPIRQVTAAVEAYGVGRLVSLPPSDGGEIGILTEAIRRFIEREGLVRATLESANDAIITLTPDGAVTSWNSAAEQMYGYTATDAVGQSINIIVPADRVVEEQEILTRAMAGTPVHHFETVRETRDGEMINVSMTISPLRDHTGAIVGASKITRDITQRMRLQNMVRLAVEASPAGMIVVNGEGQIELANGAVGRMFGYDTDMLLGQSVDRLVPAAIRDQHVKDRVGYQRSPVGRAMGVGRDLLALRRDGSEFPVEVGLNPLPNDGERRVLAVVVDITERRRAEAEIRARTEELERSNAELAQFAYVASHDLQEPLRMVASFCELLKQTQADRLDTDGLEYLGFAVDGARRMQQLINDLLAYSRLNTRPPVPTHVSCMDALANVRLNLRALIEESGATVESDELPDVLCDRTQIEQLLQNLISNAIKFRSDDPPLVRIRAERDGRFWRFSISDNGIGIDPQHYDRIFGVFQRLHTRDEYPGTGIGLAVCKRIVERLGGAIWVESGEGRGSTFCFTLPAAGG